MKTHIALAMTLVGTLVLTSAAAQTCKPNIRRSAPDDRYVVNAEQGMVLDQQTGLTWKRCVEGRTGDDCGRGFQTYLNWADALRHSADSTFAGYTDWRLPNVKELESLVEVACYGPAINTTVFPNDLSTDVWSSTPDPYNSSDRFPLKAWYVDFEIGFSGSEYRIYNYGYRYIAVRLVRGGQ